MRYFSFIAFLMCLSCTANKAMVARVDYEIAHYDLDNVDTFVDIGCGNAGIDVSISHKYPQMNFILEDLPKDIWGNDLLSALSKTVKNSPYSPTFKTNSKIVIGAADSIPLPTGRYERVLCRITLHEFTHVEKMVSELSRILSPKGKLMILENVSAYPGERDKACKQLYLTKNQIINSFSNLKLTDSIPMPLLRKNAYLFKFSKKS